MRKARQRSAGLYLTQRWDPAKGIVWKRWATGKSDIQTSLLFLISHPERHFPLKDFAYFLQWRVEKRVARLLKKTASKRGRHTNERKSRGTSLAVQWSRLHAANEEGKDLIPSRRVKVPHATWLTKIKEKKLYVSTNLSTGLSG